MRAPPLDSRFRGNDEVLFDGYCLSQRQYFGASAVMANAARFLHTLLRRSRLVARAVRAGLYRALPMQTGAIVGPVVAVVEHVAVS